MNYVIIGNSAAAVGAVEGIRSRDPAGQIVMISKEPHHTYSRPLISYLLCGKTDLTRMKYRPDSFYQDNHVRTMLGRTVAALDPAEKQVVLENGETVNYDRLLAATGSSPFIPPMQGLDAVRQKFTFMTLDDALSLERALTCRSRVLIIGAGLIGLKCAEGIYGKCAQITVVDLAPRILPSILDETGAGMVQSYLEDKGLRFVLGQSVARFEGDCAILPDGSRIDFDVLVVAVGVRANTAVLETAGAQVSRGVKTDLHCRTTLQDVYAAGDCAQSHDLVSDTDCVLALLPNAYMQGFCAGVNMAGGDQKFETAMPMNAMGLLGLHIITAGRCEGQSDVVVQKDNYKRLCYHDDRLFGYILIGNVERAGIYTALIREKTPLSSIDFELIKQQPQLMAFSKRKRAEHLGGYRG
jgi:NAD(P)H-nitrite reductase large subunit